MRAVWRGDDGRIAPRVLARGGGACRVAAVLSVLVSAAACGYALAGRGSTLPPDIRIIGVPDLINESRTSNIDRVLTDAVRAEFQGRGRYSVQPQATGVDAVLTGKVTNVELQPVAFTTESQVRRYVIVVTASVEFKDLRRNQVLWSNPAFQVRDEYDVTTGTVPNDPEALFRQDAPALDRLAKSFARTVGTSIFEAF